MLPRHRSDDARQYFHMVDTIESGLSLCDMCFYLLLLDFLYVMYQQAHENRRLSCSQNLRRYCLSHLSASSHSENLLHSLPGPSLASSAFFHHFRLQPQIQHSPFLRWWTRPMSSYLFFCLWVSYPHLLIRHPLLSKNLLPTNHLYLQGPRPEDKSYLARSVLLLHPVLSVRPHHSRFPSILATLLLHRQSNGIDF